MKKIFRMTIFKKTFLIIFAGLLCIEGVHFYLDVKAETDRVTMEHVGYYNQIRYKLSELTDVKWNSTFTKEEAISLVYDAFKEENGYFSIISSNLNINEEPLYEFSPSYFTDAPWIAFKESSSLDMSLFNKEEIEKIENYMCNTNSLLNVKYQIEECDDKTDEITYISINNDISIGEISNDKDIIVDQIDWYKGYGLFYNTYYDNESNIVPYMIIKEDYFDGLRKASVEIYDNYDVSGDTRTGIKRVGNDLYISLKGKIKIGINGYFVNFSVLHEGAYDYVFYNCISEKGAAYKIAIIASLIMSLLISYMLTKRIKAMEKQTKEIADNNFHVKLDEKYKDELGDLSTSINKMSSNHKDTIDKLNLEIEQVKRLESLRKDFINQFTHEMKTPLGIINGYSELIEVTDDENEKQRYLTLINQETARINELVLSMLKLSRLEAGKVELHKEDIDLEYLTVNVVDEFEVLLKQKNIKVIINCIDSHIVGDKEQLTTVIRNFISNAIKHTDSKIIITIDKGIKVFNEGIPIDKDKINGIWYTFVTHDKTGTGLGLAICRSILELHQYHYGVENKENGVDFYFFE